MSFVILAENVLEASGSTVTVTPTPANPGRLSDRERTLRCDGAAAWGAQYGLLPLPLSMVAAAMTIDVDLGAAASKAAWAVLGHTLAGTVTLLADNTSPPTTSVDSFTAVSGTDAYRTFAALSRRYWRVTTPAGGGIGELLLGTHGTVATNPSIPTGKKHTVGNVRRWRSPGGFAWDSQLGAKRARMLAAWNVLSAAELTTIETEFDNADQGAKHVLIQIPDGTLYWVEWTDEALAPDGIGNSLYRLNLAFEEAL